MAQIQYSYSSKYHYDGVSEFQCKCGYRQGRWCGEELHGHEVERVFCDGKHGHPIEVDLDD